MLQWADCLTRICEEPSWESLQGLFIRGEKKTLQSLLMKRGIEGYRIA